MSSNAHLEMRPPVNYVFVDYENVHDVDLSLVGNKAVYLTLLLGPRQSKLDAELVEKLVAHASAVQLVRLTSAAKNALDFALSYYLGKAVQADPNAFFHIVSKDAGFDPLIEHLQSRHVKARRHEDYAALTFTSSPKAAAAPATPEDFQTRAIAHLQKNSNNRPKRKKTLLSHLAALSGKTAPEMEIDALVANLCKAGHLSIGETGAVTYHFRAN